ncbi:hypothetical protein VTO42DRAFT_7072 [Malbranchea cinnamomea]
MIEETLKGLTVRRAAGGAGISLALLLVIWELLISYRVRKLGASAPQLKSWLPFGLDFIYKAMKKSTKAEDLVFWQNIIASRRLPNGQPTATVELRLRSFARSIFTVDPENIKAVLTGQFADYGKGERFHQEFREFLGDSIFATDGELWSRSRHLIRPMFARDRLIHTEMFEEHVDKLLRLLSPEANANRAGVVDVSPLFFRLTLDAATDHLLGQAVNSLDDPKTVFAESFQFVLHKQSMYFRAGPVSPLLSRTEYRKHLRIMDEFIQPFIDAVLRMTPDQLDRHLAKKDTFLHALARFTRDPKVIRDQLVAILLAGRDTTAATLSFCLFELARHPHVVAKLRDEIAAKVGHSRPPSYADLKDMKYLTAVLNETMRLYPVVPFNVRHSLVDTTLPRGGGPDGSLPIGVPRDTRILYSTMAMQRRPELYDPPPSSSRGDAPYYDPRLFCPDRWVSGWQPKPWQFIPFNGGPRICLGQQFAMIEMGYTVTRIFQTFKEVRGVGHPPPGTDPKFKFDITLSPGQELNMEFVRA